MNSQLSCTKSAKDTHPKDNRIKAMFWETQNLQDIIAFVIFFSSETVGGGAGGVKA